MGTDLQKPQSFQDIVRDRVRTVIMDAVPDEQIDALIQAEWKSFFESRKTTGYNSTTLPSPFSQMVESAIRNELKEKVRAQVNTMMDGFNVEDDVDSAVARLAPKVLKSVIEEFTRTVIQNVSQSY